MPYEVTHVKDAEGFDLLCDRTSVWGNPFPMKGKSDEERDRVIQEYRRWLWNEIRVNNGIDRLLMPIIERKNSISTPLRLACWCAPKPCHCDVLVRACEWHEHTIAQQQSGLDT